MTLLFPVRDVYAPDRQTSEAQLVDDAARQGLDIPLWRASRWELCA